MNASMITGRDERHYELRFRSLYDEGRGYAFPCDQGGQVTLDQLNERARSNYLYARAMIGREFGWPEVQMQLH